MDLLALNKIYYDGPTNKTQIYIDIADDGPRFNIWFNAKIGHVREVRSKLSIDILKIFPLFKPIVNR